MRFLLLGLFVLLQILSAHAYEAKSLSYVRVTRSEDNKVKFEFCRKWSEEYEHDCKILGGLDRVRLLGGYFTLAELENQRTIELMQTGVSSFVTLAEASVLSGSFRHNRLRLYGNKFKFDTFTMGAIRSVCFTQVGNYRSVSNYL